MFVNAGEFLFWVSAQRGSVFLLLLLVFSVVAAANGFAPKVFFFCRRRLEGCPRGVTEDYENKTRKIGIILTTTSEEDKWVKFYARVLFVCIVLVFVVGKEFYFFFCLLLFLLSSITLRGG